MIWQNVSISGWEKSIRGVFVYLLIAALTLGFAIPVAIAGSLSQIKYLASAAVWLHWTLGLPGWIIAVVQGVLPQAIVSLITGFVPTMLRFLAKRQGFHLRQVLENYVHVPICGSLPYSVLIGRVCDHCWADGQIREVSTSRSCPEPAQSQQLLLLLHHDLHIHFDRAQATPAR